MFRKCATLRNRVLVLAVAGALGVAGTALAAVPAGGQFSVLTQATALNRGDVVQSAVPINRPIRITVALSLRSGSQLDAFLKTPGHGSMSSTQLQRFLPTQGDAQAVAAYLRGAGFTHVQVTSNRMLVNATGTAAAIQSAFKTTLVSVRTKDGRDAFANSSAIHIPAALSGKVVAVLGLQTVHKVHTYNVRATSTNDQPGITGHMPQEFADIYGASGLAPATSINAAVWGWGSMENTVNDLTDFEAATGLSAGTVNVVCTDINGIYPNGFGRGGISIGDPTCNGNFDEGETEWAMDSQDIVAMAGGTGSLTFYASYGGYNTTMLNTLSEIVTPTMGEPLAQVINGSFGECERFQDRKQGGDGSLQADNQLFRIGAAQGQTFSISTGDSGYDECGDGQLNSASFPASSPFVVAVSGTTLRATSTTWARENVWAGSGGSPSSANNALAWQAPLTYGQFAGARGPDVAFDANPASGALVLLQGNYYQVGGTSLSAPLFAGAWARILQGNPGLGAASRNLYQLPASALHDIRAGNNGAYLAKPGWDWVTGLGSFDVGQAAAALSD